MYGEDDNSILLINNGDQVKLKVFLRDKGLSRRLITKALKKGQISLGNKVCTGKEQINSDAKILFRMEDERSDMIPEEMELDILYEDSDVLALNKRPFQLVHPTPNHQDGTLANGVAWYFLKNNIKRKIRIINRLDRDTSGVILFAKNPFGHQQMAMQMEERTVEKIYLAVVHGNVRNDSGIIDRPLGKHEDGIRQKVSIDGSRALTRYRVIERFAQGTLLELDLLTGRTHQLRVHLSHLGNPIMGDNLYSKFISPINRQALHAYKMSFNNIRSKKRVIVEAELPEDIKELINIL